jgi:hypothetical protein
MGGGELGVFPGLENVPLPMVPSLIGQEQPGGESGNSIARQLTLLPPVDPHPGPADDLGDPGAELADTGWPVRTDWDGSFRIGGLPSGRLRLIASHPSASTGRSEELVLRAGDHLDEVEIVLDPGTELAGRVLDTQGFPLEGAVVELLGGSSRQGSVEVTTSDGAFTFAIASGSVQLAVSKDGYADASVPILIESSLHRQEVEIRLIEANRRLIGRVVDGRGYPVEGARVEARSLDRGRLMVVTTLGADDGTFELEGLAGETIVVRAEAPRYSESVAVVGPGQDEVAIRLEASGAVSVDVVDEETGRAVVSCRVEVVPSSGEPQEQVCVDGRSNLIGIAPGRATLRVRAPDHADAEVSVEIFGGVGPNDPEASHQVALVPSLILRGRVVDLEGEPVIGARVGLGEPPSVWAARGEPNWVVSGREGRFDLNGVPREAVSLLWVLHPIQGRGFIEVGPFWPQDEPDFEIMVDDSDVRSSGGRHQGVAVTLAVRADQVVLDEVAPGSIAERAGMRSGDLLLSIDGQPVVGVASAYRDLRGARGTALLVSLSRGTVDWSVMLERELVER